MRPRPPGLRRTASPPILLTAAATPVVAAALVAVALVVASCQARPVVPPGPAATATLRTSVPGRGGADPGPPSAAPTRVSGGANPGPPSPAPTAGADATAARATRLLVVVGLPARPRAEVRDTDRPSAAGLPVALPEVGAPLATVAVAADGRVAAVAADGRAWIAAGIDGGGRPAWTPIAGPVPVRAGPVLGAAWTVAGDGLVLVAGFPGSGTRRTTLLTLPLDGSPGRLVEVPLEADGPGLAALPSGEVAFVARDLGDRSLLARVDPSGTVTTAPLAARTIASAGDLVALADDATVRVGTLAALDRGRLSSTPLPLGGPAGIGPVALSPDGSRAAVVRLDGDGRALRVDVLRLAEGQASDVVALGLDPADGTAIAGFLP